MKIIEVKRKPRKCPVCGGKVANIIYGEPNLRFETMKEVEEGKIVFGDCCKFIGGPEYRCIKCGQDFKKGSREEQLRKEGDTVKKYDPEEYESK